MRTYSWENYSRLEGPSSSIPTVTAVLTVTLPVSLVLILTAILPATVDYPVALLLVIVLTIALVGLALLPTWSRSMWYERKAQKNIKQHVEYSRAYCDTSMVEIKYYHHVGCVQFKKIPLDIPDRLVRLGLIRTLYAAQCTCCSKATRMDYRDVLTGYANVSLIQGTGRVLFSGKCTRCNGVLCGDCTKDPWNDGLSLVVCMTCVEESVQAYVTLEPYSGDGVDPY